MESSQFWRDVGVAGFAPSGSADHFQSRDPGQLWIQVYLFLEVISSASVAALALDSLEMQGCARGVALQTGRVGSIFGRESRKGFGVR